MTRAENSEQSQREFFMTLVKFKVFLGKSQREFFMMPVNFKVFLGKSQRKSFYNASKL